ncbi:MAG: HAMP domain-containing sensor histidine kinase [Desulfosarcina sp.]
MIQEPIKAGQRADETDDVGFFKEINVEFLIHELKDPISVIETAVRMLLEKTDKYGTLTERQEKTLRRALRNSKKARGLLADLLEVGRSDVGCFQCGRFNAFSAVREVLMEALETCDPVLWDTIQETHAGSAPEASLMRYGIHIVCSEGARGAELYQDEAKFRQIVGNLIKNAFHHRRQRLDIDLDCQRDRLIVAIADDGPGVDIKARELIFKRYTRLGSCEILSRTGHGLGLAGARILARHLGGDVSVNDPSGGGATFSLSLPLILRINP